MEYIVIIEKSENGFGAFVPDLPGCVAVAETREETVQLIKEAVELHIESLRESGQSVPRRNFLSRSRRLSELGFSRSWNPSVAGTSCLPNPRTCSRS